MGTTPTLDPCNGKKKDTGRVFRRGVIPSSPCYSPFNTTCFTPFSLIDTDRAIPFTALASAPTVTLPRLKALTTGAVPGFLDAILNIAESDQSSTLANQDNWIAQLARSPSQRANAHQATEGDKVVQQRNIGFFGDDTWIKLFPGLFFRTDGTSSFFAMVGEHTNQLYASHMN